MSKDESPVYTYSRISETIDLEGKAEEKKPRKETRKPWKVLTGKRKTAGVWAQELRRVFQKVLSSDLRRQDLFHLFATLILARGMIMGELLPFGGAYLAATLVLRPNLALLLIGCLVIGLFSSPLPKEIWTQLVIGFILAGVITSSRRKLEQWWIPLPFLVFSTYLAVGNFFLVWQGWNLYQEIAVVFEAIIAGVLAFVFLVILQWIESPEKSKPLRMEQFVGLIVLGTCLVLSLSDITLGSWPLSPILASLGVLIAAYLGGAGAGSATGALLGLLPSVTFLIMPFAVGIYAVSGLIAGFFRPWGRLGITMGFFLGNLAMTLYLTEAGANPTSLIQLGCGVVLFWLIPKSVFTRLGLQNHLLAEKIFSSGETGKNFIGAVFPTWSKTNTQTVNADAAESEPAPFPEENTGPESAQPAESAFPAQSHQLKENEGPIFEGGRAERLWWKLTDGRLKNLSNLLNEISATLESEKVVLDDNPEKFINLFERVRLDLCQNCSAHQACWQEDFYQTYRVLLDILAEGEKKETSSITLEQVLPKLKNRCLYPRDLVHQVNLVQENLRLQNYWQDRVDEGRDLVNHQVKGLAGVVSEVLSEFEKEAVRVKTLEKQIMREIKPLGIVLERLQVFRLPSGDLEIYFSRPKCSEPGDCQNRLVQVLSAIVKQPLEMRPDQCSSLSNCEICFVSCGHLTVQVGVCRRAEDGYDCSGDNFLAMRLPGTRYLLALSDGMGVGPQASATSQLMLNLFEMLLGTGMHLEQAVRAVNSLMLLRTQEERFATLDLIMVDLHTGKAEFLKLGAPPSFLRRQGRVTMVSASAPPVGILDALEVRSWPNQLQVGDLMVLVTDGLLDSRYHVSERDTWLVGTLEKLKNGNPQKIAEEIMQEALSNSSKVRDDMAVLVARIEEQ